VAEASEKDKLIMVKIWELTSDDRKMISGTKINQGK
jgi:hypothetical protein